MITGDSLRYFEFKNLRIRSKDRLTFILLAFGAFGVTCRVKTSARSLLGPRRRSLRVMAVSHIRRRRNYGQMAIFQPKSWKSCCLVADKAVLIVLQALMVTSFEPFSLNTTVLNGTRTGCATLKIICHILPWCPCCRGEMCNKLDWKTHQPGISSQFLITFWGDTSRILVASTSPTKPWPFYSRSCTAQKRPATTARRVILMTGHGSLRNRWV